MTDIFVCPCKTQYEEKWNADDADFYDDRRFSLENKILEKPNKYRNLNKYDRHSCLSYIKW